MTPRVLPEPDVAKYEHAVTAIARVPAGIGLDHQIESEPIHAPMVSVSLARLMENNRRISKGLRERYMRFEIHRALPILCV